MAKAVKGSRSRKKKQEEELIDVDTVDTEDDELEVDTDEEIEETDTVIEDDEESEDDSEEDTEDDSDEDQDEEVTVEVVNDDFKAVNVLVLKDVPRFLIGTGYQEALKEGQKTKLPKYVAEHLKERGRVQIV